MRLNATTSIIVLVALWSACSTKVKEEDVFSGNLQIPTIGVQNSDVSSEQEDEGAIGDQGLPSEDGESAGVLGSKVRSVCGDGVLAHGEFCFSGHSPPLELDDLDDIRSLSLGDWDKDGLPDLLITRLSTRRFQILGSTEEAPFSKLLLDQEMPGDTEPYTGTFLDLNEDNRLDIVVSGTGYELITLKGDGEGNVYDFLITPFVMSFYYSRWRWMELRDFNGDGLLDLVGFRDVYENSKWGQALVSLQNSMNSFNYPRNIGSGRDTVFVDLDHDGDLDLVMEHKTGEHIQLIYQDSSEPMSPVFELVEGPPGSSGGPVPWRIPLDEPVEILIGASDEMRFLRFDDTNQEFELSTLATADELRVNPWHPRELDADMDGAREILWSLTSGSRFALMEPEAEDALSHMILGDAGPSRDRVTIGDADGDGLPEALFYSAMESGLRIVDLDPEGMAKDSVAQLLSNRSMDQVMVGDFNGDGLDDLAGVRGDTHPKLYLSDGLGGVSEEIEIPVDGLTATGLSVGDVDGDDRDEILLVGTQRLVVGGLDEEGAPWHQVQMLSHGVYALTVAEEPDVNGDGHADLYVTASNRKVHMYLGAGDGSFEHYWTGSHDGDSASVRSGDFNGDGFAGVVVFGRYPKTLTRTFHNTAGTLATIPSTLSLTKRHVEVGDVNGDGLDDLVSAAGGGAAQIAFSIPGDSFLVVERDGDPKDEQTGLAVVDLDGQRGDEIVVPDAGDLLVLSADFNTQQLVGDPPKEVARFSKRGVQRRLVPADVNGDGFMDLWSVRSGILVNAFINRP